MKHLWQAGSECSVHGQMHRWALGRDEVGCECGAYIPGGDGTTWEPAAAAQLVSVDLDRSRPVSEVAMPGGRCATCRWAVGAHTFDTRKANLECTRFRHPGGLMTPGAGYAEGDSFLAVEPSFGCVQWEGK